MKNNNFYASMLIALFILLSFTGCTQSDSPTTTHQSNAISSAGNSRNFSYAGINEFVETSDGLYELQVIHTNSVSVFYTDYQTHNRIYLCANPECKHDSDICQSYMSNPSQFSPILLHAGDMLFVVFGGTDDKSPHVIKMSLDGSGKTELFQLQANQVINGTFITDNQFLYFDITEVSNDGKSQYKLLKSDIQTGELTQVCELGNDAQYYTLTSFADDKLCLLRNAVSPGEKNAYILLDPSYPSFDNVIYEYLLEQPVMVYGQYIFVADIEKCMAIRIDMVLGDKLSIPYQVDDKYTVIGLSKSYGGNAMIEAAGPLVGGSYDIDSYLIDFSDGSCSEIELKAEYNNRTIIPIGEYGDNLCVIVDFDEYTVPQMDSEDILSEFWYISNRYALIAKADFKNSVPNYIEINNAF